jgi:hypothetical protein
LIEQNLIESKDDIFKLDIIDWGRCRPWENPLKALESIASFFIGHAWYTIIELDLREAPERDDWPGWNHVGNHEYYGRLYWNWFHQYQKGDLRFHDAPDFSGTLLRDDGNFSRFWGDIGRVSVRAFSDAQVNMHVEDLWISIVDEYRQVIIETG